MYLTVLLANDYLRAKLPVSPYVIKFLTPRIMVCSNYGETPPTGILAEL